MQKKPNHAFLSSTLFLLVCITVLSIPQNLSAKEYNQLEMPVIAIDTISGNDITSNEEYADAKISIIDTSGHYEMQNTHTTIKLRGKSSLHADKKSYKIKFNKKQNLLNMGDGSGKPWALIANCFDTSLLRNLTAYRFSDLLTNLSYSPNCRSVELFINAEYRGVYLLCETVNISKSRVAINEESNEVEKNGYLVEMSRYATENNFTVDTAVYEVKNDLSPSESLREKQIDYIAGYIETSFNALKRGNQREIKKYIDIDSLVDIYIGNEIVKNVDAGWDSFYMYKNENGKLRFGPMWDFDLAMGNANCVKGFDSWAGFNPYHILNVNANSNPWFCYALSNKWFRKLVKKRWNKLQTQIDGLAHTVVNEAEQYNKSYLRNFEKWDVLGQQVHIEPVQIADLTTFKEHYTYLSRWLENRTKWLTGYYNGRDFKKGIFIDERGNKLNAHSNLLAISSILALALAPEVDMSYEILADTGISMTIVNGGLEEWQTQICATGFMVEKGMEYVLSFDYKCSSERSLSFAIQQNYEPWSLYYAGDLNFTKTLQHFEGSFTATDNDSNCAFSFSLGSDTFNNTVVTIDNMNLTKKSVTS